MPHLRRGVMLFLLLPGGCAAEIRPGVAYSITFLTQADDGKAMLQGAATAVDGVAVGAVQKLTHEGKTFSVAVRKTQYQKATFDVTFPDDVVERVQVKVGQPRDILPAEQKIGIRIELRESH